MHQLNRSIKNAREAIQAIEKLRSGEKQTKQRNKYITDKTAGRNRLMIKY